MRTSPIIQALAIICITAIEIFAMVYLGIDGAVLAFSCTIIGGIAGYNRGKPREIMQKEADYGPANS